jgi:RNA polymerase sigma factor (sigma-70 family)
VAPEPMTVGGFEAFYKAQYVGLVRLLVVLDASVEEAEDAAQKAMMDLFRRLTEGTDAVVNPVPWVRRAAHNYFVKERQRDRARLPHESKGGHLTLDFATDDSLTAWEDEQHLEQLLGELTPGQRIVLRLVLAGLSGREIAERLGKGEANIRQQLKNGRDRLRVLPEIAARARQGGLLRGARSLVLMPEAPEVADQ